MASYQMEMGRKPLDLVGNRNSKESVNFNYYGSYFLGYSDICLFEFSQLTQKRCFQAVRTIFKLLALFSLKPYLACQQ